MKRRVRITIGDRLTGTTRRVRVTAEVYGPFAIHRTWFDSEETWRAADTYVITHIPTGLAIGKHWPSLAVAKSVAKTLRPMAKWDRVHKKADVPKGAYRTFCKLADQHGCFA